ncbi:Lrp/AsnC family transcriptional regulator [Archaeoglobus veneficus]|uniref:siroheme decarboxylase n=1 Tax=Archaeoglobus veneficus (strain DSM 11195 / SNP6) TaxID=693661 RepID=F2KQ32_ARCVS|nr:Lrp/AsnC family transcriptional regulator [Archaeoglobus veneficus]AEA47635.1 putative transcriptional regulator, AsnC family [Archaeoglobus veneficus SNP6]
MFSENDVRLLMAIQYRLPLCEQPLLELAEREKLDPDFVLRRVKEFREKGVIKRYGANLNYRAFSTEHKAALVGANVEEDRIKEVARIINAANPKHNYWREHEHYSVWFTIKARNEEELFSKIDELMKKCNVEDYVVLPTKRVYKMDVKYDLIKGISWSEKSLEKFDVPKVEELGLDASLLRRLESLDVCERPFSKFAENGYTESELVDLIAELIKKGVVRDFSGVLKERKIGFLENGMTVIKTDNPEKLALKLVEELPQITHLVERKVPDGWQYPLYFMVHATRREPIEKIRESLRGYGVEDTRTLYSKADLKEQA